MSRKVFIAVVALLSLGVVAPAQAKTDVAPFEYGYFYGTFGEDPNIVLLAGGDAQDFCDSENPGTTRARTKVLDDGSVTVSADQGAQPIYLYYVLAEEGAPGWLDRICASGEIPEAFASGHAKLRVRDSYVFEGGPPTHISNSVRGTAVGTDGTKYRVFGGAEIPFVDGAPVGTPPEWVSFSLTARG